MLIWALSHRIYQFLSVTTLTFGNCSNTDYNNGISLAWRLYNKATYDYGFQQRPHNRHFAFAGRTFHRKWCFMSEAWIIYLDLGWPSIKICFFSWVIHKLHHLLWHYSNRLYRIVTGALTVILLSCEYHRTWMRSWHWGRQATSHYHFGIYSFTWTGIMHAILECRTLSMSLPMYVHYSIVSDM